ncbi:MAG: hypothetical protein GTO63_18850 [Anaerolineae bacterium]|nr:hypothetical protein [Anaerolineae bacterium]NIN96833.1 hypothetical protein [Anaerolineae bacterium]NIQ79814.1 hypothetical protein [Anaerolineae bacterium]
MYRVSDRVAYTVLSVLGGLCLMTFLVVRVPRAQGNLVLNEDGKSYFSYLRSFVFDGDLDFRNEFTQLRKESLRTTATGLTYNGMSVGPAVLWSPFYLSSHVLSLMAHSVGVELDVDGYGLVYQSAVSVATIMYVTVGSFLTYRVCRRYFCSWVSLVGVAGVWLASSLFHYTVGAPDMAHGVSFFAVSLFIFVWHPPRSRTYTEWILLGLSAGLMTLVRWQNLLYVSVLAVEGIRAVNAAGGAGRRAALLQEYAKGGLLVGISGLFVFAPQMVVWNTLFGLPATIPQGSDIFDWLHPSLLEYLFSMNHGFYTWTPVMLIATLGLVFLWKRDRKVTVALLIALLLQWYLNSAHRYWWAHGSFGARRVVSATSLLVLGLAAITEHVANRFRRGPVVALATVAGLTIWNLLFDLQFSWGFIPRDQAISLHQLTVGKVDMVLELIGRIVPLP